MGVHCLLDHSFENWNTLKIELLKTGSVREEDKSWTLLREMLKVRRNIIKYSAEKENQKFQLVITIFLELTLFQIFHIYVKVLTYMSISAYAKEVYIYISPYSESTMYTQTYISLVLKYLYILILTKFNLYVTNSCFPLLCIC